MKNPHTTLCVGVYRRIDVADRAVRALVESGIPKDRISVLCPEGAAKRLPEGVESEGRNSAEAPDAALTGGAIGALLGGLASAVGVAATGGIGLLAAGPLLAGAGAVAGGLLGAMTSRGFAPELADYYDQAVASGATLVIVDTEGLPGELSPDQVSSLLEKHGAEPVALPGD